MPRLARVVAPGVPHHITQRGNRRLPTFFVDADYVLYLKILAEWTAHWNVDIWAYCLMPNHTHLVAVPPTAEALSRAIGETHRRYTYIINKSKGWSGYLWQGRFASFPMDERHLYLGVRYVELNPVRANLVELPWEYRWSSAAAHLAGKDDGIVKVKPLLDMFGDWRKFLTDGLTEHQLDRIRGHVRTGRPLGENSFIDDLEKQLDRTDIKLRRPGRKKIEGHNT